MKLTLLDLVLIGVSALSSAVLAGLSTDAANQYVEAHWLFWLRLSLSAVSATCTTLLGYLKARDGLPLGRGKQAENGAGQPGQAGVAIGSETQK